VELYKKLYCIDCHGKLQKTTSSLRCVHCKREYEFVVNAISFVKTTNSSHNETHPDSLIYSVKNYLRKYPWVFLLIYRFIYPRFGKTAKKFVQELPKDAMIINLGSGVINIDSRVIDVDCESYPNVLILADAHRLPFKNESIDAVLCEALIEHVADPRLVISEINRILKPGGWIYLSAPFIFGYHSSPDDYYRWTTSGLKELLGDFHESEVGIVDGPTAALITVLREWLSIIFSFGNGVVYQFLNLIFMIVLAPINWLDFILSRYRHSSNIASGLYFIGRKK